MPEEKKLRTEIIELAKYIIDRSGMRSLITIVIDIGILYFIYLGKVESLIGLSTLSIVTVSFFILRHFERNGSKGEFKDESSSNL